LVSFKKVQKRASPISEGGEKGWVRGRPITGGGGCLGTSQRKKAKRSPQTSVWDVESGGLKFFDGPSHRGAGSRELGKRKKRKIKEFIKRGEANARRLGKGKISVSREKKREVGKSRKLLSKKTGRLVCFGKRGEKDVPSETEEGEIIYGNTKGGRLFFDIRERKKASRENECTKRGKNRKKYLQKICKRTNNSAVVNGGRAGFWRTSKEKNDWPNTAKKKKKIV